MPESLALLFSQQFLMRALVVGILISLCCALLGVSLVLKRFSMIGDGLSHVGFGALAIACAANVAPLYFSIPIVVVAAFLLLRMNERGKIKGDSAIALISTGSLAIGIMVTSMTSGMNVDIYNYMFGSILTMSRGDVVLSVILSVAVIVLFVVFYDEIFSVTFDESFAKATGTNVSLYNMLIAALTAVTIVVGMRMMGALLISSLIIFPSVTSMRVCKSFKNVVMTSVAVSVICFFSGLVVSIRFEAPTGASIVCVNILMLAAFSLLGYIINLSEKSKLFKVKKLLAAAVAVLTVLGLLVPLFGDVKLTDKASISIVTTSFAPYDFLRQICGDRAEVTMLLSPGEESHTFEPTPNDIMMIENCDVFVYGGGESDEWVDKILSSIDTSKMKTVKMMDTVSLKKEELLEGMEAEEEDDEDDEYDEHVWTSPLNAIKIVEAITSSVCDADSSNSSYYLGNSEKYIEQLQKLNESFENLSETANGKSFIVADRFPFKYFADEYGLKFYAAFPGCSAQVEANPKTIAFLNKKANAEKINTVFKVDLSTGTVANAMSEATGTKVETLYSCHVVSAEQFKNGETYISLMRHNEEVLRSALSSL